MKSLLKQPVEGSQGTANACRMNNIDVGAKTGTTQKEYDVWLCGFTPYYTAATWVGYDQPETINTYGGSPATLIWASVMKNIHANMEAKTFEKPENVVTARVCRTSGKCATSSCTNTYEEYFVEGTVPDKCEGHNAFEVCSESKKLATENCPHTETVWGLAVPEKEVNAKWKTNGGGKYTVITEKCDVHTAKSNDNKNKKEEKKEKNENSTVVTTEVPVDTDVTVPNVVGLTEAAAKSALSYLSVTIEYQESESKNNGKVISQSISAGSVVSKQAKIKLVVGRYEKKETPTVPKDEPETPNQQEKPSTPTETEEPTV